MRIAFWGKGGSGKTTTSASFITYLSEKFKDKNILAIDADSNVHLGGMLGIEEMPAYLGSNFDDLANLLEGSNTLYKTLGFSPIPEVGSIPPSNESAFVFPKQDDPILSKYTTQRGNIQLAVAGPHEKEDESDSCYHVKLFSLELLLHRLLDTKEDWVVADITAGVDTMGTSLIAAYDINLFVVEPTRKSVDLCKHWLELFNAREGMPYVGVIANKVRDQKDLDFIAENLNVPLLTHVEYDTNLRRYEQGKQKMFDAFVDAHADTWEQLISLAQGQEKDWTGYLDNLLHYHIKGSEGWWDGYTGKPVSTTYDPDFTYESVLKK